MRPRTEIIILKYKRPEYESRCVNHIIEHTSERTPYTVRLIDTRKDPVHFSRMWNQYIKESTCDYIVIMDSDAFILTDDWLELMHEAYDQFPNASVVLTELDNGGPDHQRVVSDGPIETESGTPVVALYRKSIFDKVGWFDEDPRFKIFGQDSEWVWRGVQKGFKPVVQHSVKVEHVGNGSTRKAHADGEFVFEDVQNQAIERFKEVREQYASQRT